MGNFDYKTFYLSMDGRIGREEYWKKLILPVFLIALVLGIVARGNSMISAIFNLLVLWPSIAVSAKRWHDRDKSAWWILIGIVPIIGWIWVLVENGFLKGTEGPNRYGANPV